MCASIERQRGGGRKGDERDRLLRWLRVVQIEILRLLFLILIGRRRRRGGRQVLMLFRLLLHEVMRVVMLTKLGRNLMAERPVVVVQLMVQLPRV